MNYKLNILEPWDSGTETAINISIAKETENQLLLYLQTPIQYDGKIVQYLTCEFKSREERHAFKSHILTKKSTKRKRNLTGTGLVDKTDLGNVKMMLCIGK